MVMNMLVMTLAKIVEFYLLLGFLSDEINTYRIVGVGVKTSSLPLEI